MTDDLAMSLAKDMLWTVMLVGGPVLGLSMLVGLVVSLLQVVTQIQDSSIIFVPKLLTVGACLVVFGPWMLRTLVQYATSVITHIPGYF